MLKLKRADEINTSKKARVLFCSHPNDFNQYFETVSRDIHSLNNCDIYYYENGILSISDDWESDCFAINLIKEQYYITPASRKTSAEVFISYSSRDQDIADMLVSVADNAGVKCWIASSSIGAGSYAKQIVQGIKEARIFVVIVSESAILSPHVKNELDLATSRIKDGLIIMPFKIDDSELDDECRYYLGRQEFFMGIKPPIEERIKQFVNSIKKVL